MRILGRRIVFSRGYNLMKGHTYLAVSFYSNVTQANVTLMIGGKEWSIVLYKKGSMGAHPDTIC